MTLPATQLVFLCGLLVLLINISVFLIERDEPSNTGFFTTLSIAEYLFFKEVLYFPGMWVAGIAIILNVAWIGHLFRSRFRKSRI